MLFAPYPPWGDEGRVWDSLTTHRRQSRDRDQGRTLSRLTPLYAVSSTLLCMATYSAVGGDQLTTAASQTEARCISTCKRVSLI